MHAFKICRHFGECGGCAFQDIDYPEQLKLKKKGLEELITSYGLKTELKPFNFYENWFYRNKMEFTFAKDERIICGLYGRNDTFKKRRIIDIKECLIFSPEAGKILAAVKGFFEMQGYPVYDKWRHRGFLRNLILRQTRFTHQIMLGLVTTGVFSLNKEGLVKYLSALELEGKIMSIYWIINDSLSDAVVFEKKELIYGEPFITETLGDFTFYIGIDSFFQVNSLGIKDLYSKVRDYAQLTGREKVLDLFCGLGCIGLYLAKSADFVWGVEINPRSVELAFKNAQVNNIKNISFLNAEVKSFLSLNRTFYKDIDVLTLNPPRAGISAKVRRQILRLKPKGIFYSSCNPQSLLRDLKDLSASYKIDFLEPFDFFPHTPHLECLAKLKIF